MTALADTVDQGDLFAHEIIPLRLAITAMRDSGYKNTAYQPVEKVGKFGPIGSI